MADSGERPAKKAKRAAGGAKSSSKDYKSGDLIMYVNGPCVMTGRPEPVPHANEEGRSYAGNEGDKVSTCSTV
jgi:hypothetical protein